MSDAQIGLTVATSLVVVFALALNSTGVLRLSGTITVIVMSLAIAASLFLTQ